MFLFKIFGFMIFYYASEELCIFFLIGKWGVGGWIKDNKIRLVKKIKENYWYGKFHPAVSWGGDALVL